MAASKGFNYKVVHFLELEDRYAIDGRLLGKRICFLAREDCRVEIVFPTIIRINGCDTLGIPGIQDDIKVDSKNWGKINSYRNISDKDTIDAWIAEVLVWCYSDDENKLLTAFDIQKLGRMVIHAIHVINPDSVRIASDSFYNNICKVDTSVSFKVDGSSRPELGITTLIDERKGRLSFREFKLAIKNAYKTVSLPYEMLDNARVNFGNNDSRATVLNCATAIEITLKQKISKYLADNKVPGPLKEHVLKQADGYSKLLELIKKLSIPLGALTNVQEKVTKVRNRVIHGGYTPTLEEAYQAYNCTRLALYNLKVNMFEFGMMGKVIEKGKSV